MTYASVLRVLRLEREREREEGIEEKLLVCLFVQPREIKKRQSFLLGK